MLATVLANVAFYLFIVAPVLAFILANRGPPNIRALARKVLLFDALAYGAATLGCLIYALGPTRVSGIYSNQVFLLPAAPLGAIALSLFLIWRAAQRRAYVASLPPAQRRVEELADIDHALEVARKELVSAEQKIGGWFVGGEERKKLELEISVLRTSIARLERDRTKWA